MSGFQKSFDIHTDPYYQYRGDDDKMFQMAVQFHQVENERNIFRQVTEFIQPYIQGQFVIDDYAEFKNPLFYRHKDDLNFWKNVYEEVVYSCVKTIIAKYSINNKTKFERRIDRYNDFRIDTYNRNLKSPEFETIKHVRPPETWTTWYREMFPYDTEDMDDPDERWQYGLRFWRTLFRIMSVFKSWRRGDMKKDIVTYETIWQSLPTIEYKTDYLNYEKLAFEIDHLYYSLDLAFSHDLNTLYIREPN